MTITDRGRIVAAIFFLLAAFAVVTFLANRPVNMPDSVCLGSVQQCANLRATLDNLDY